MKPISIRFRCFGPYVDEQYIDFAQLEANGLFLICGETGAGKTTILDAMCYALYNQSSGGIRDKGFESMRCKQAPQAEPTLVEFIFSYGGTRYKFRRVMEFKRKNYQSDHQCWEERDGEFVPLFENPKNTTVSAKAETIIGLKYEQFRQVIVLPQGQFEKLLIANSGEKEEILKTLFQVGRWQKAAANLTKQLREQGSALNLQWQSIMRLLQTYNCNTTEALASHLETAKQALVPLREQCDLATAEAAALQLKKECAMLDDEAFQRLYRQRRRLDTLLAQAEDYDQLEQRLHRAETARRIRPQYEQYCQLCLACTKAKALQAQYQAAQDNAKKKLDSVRMRQMEQEKHRSAYESNTKALTLLESKIPLYRNLDTQKQQAQNAADHYKQQRALLDSHERRFLAADRAWLDAQDRQCAAAEIYQNAIGAYRRCMGSDLARELTPGHPCPVCGSTTHPAPAKPEEQHITWDQLEAYNKAAQAAGKQVSQAARQRQQAEQERTAAMERAHQAQQEALAQQRSYEQALEQRCDGLDTLAELERQLRKLKQAITAFEAEDQALLTDLQTALSADAAARSRLDAAEEALREALRQEASGRTQWQQALEQAGFTQQAFEAACMEPSELAHKQEQLTNYRIDLAHVKTAVREQQEAVAGKAAPDMNTITEQLNAAQNAAQALREQLALETDRCSRMQQDHNRLVKQLEAYQTEKVKVDADLKFAERLKGEHGPSLQRYVLGVMLNSITVEANRLLQNVYSGRYRLFVCQDSGNQNQKSGLDLEILDHANGQRRSVKTLSGGEKFLVALSLAIGLSTVVQTQGGGVRLEAMFIDEGFGSLDRDAVCDALDILDGIRKGSGLVGIISHVEQLAESIPAKIEVRKNSRGSTCTVKY